MHTLTHPQVIEERNQLKLELGDLQSERDELFGEKVQLQTALQVQCYVCIKVAVSILGSRVGLWYSSVQVCSVQFSSVLFILFW